MMTPQRGMTNSNHSKSTCSSLYENFGFQRINSVSHLQIGSKGEKFRCPLEGEEETRLINGSRFIDSKDTDKNDDKR